MSEASPETELDFERAIAELETIVERMESGQLSLEESLRAFEDGIRLARTCQTALRRAEQKVDALVERAGRLSEEPLADDERP